MQESNSSIWSLDDGKKEIERQISNRVDRNRLPGFLDYLLNEPADECEVCEQWRKSKHFIEDEIIKCLGDIEQHALPDGIGKIKVKKAVGQFTL